MRLAWQGQIGEVIRELKQHHRSLDAASSLTAQDDSREQLRLVIQYVHNNRERMKYAEYRQQGLPTTNAWMDSAVKEMDFRDKGSDMFWNNPEGAEAILQIRAASLSDDDRLARFLSHRPGEGKLRREPNATAQAA